MARQRERATRSSHVIGAGAVGGDLKEACWRPGGGLRDPSAAIFPLVALSRPQEVGKVVRGSGGDRIFPRRRWSRRARAFRNGRRAATVSGSEDRLIMPREGGNPAGRRPSSRNAKPYDVNNVSIFITARHAAIAAAVTSRARPSRAPSLPSWPG